MNISILNESLEFHYIVRLSKYKAGLKVEVFVFISSLIILITTVPIVSRTQNEVTVEPYIISLIYCHPV